ncbi:integrase, partial [Clostridioides sp. ZZV14-6048]|nr:integrase [Clostridioides sp. ZZV14-6048]
MNWNDLKKCDINDIVGYINEKLIKYKSLKKVSDKLEINESTIRKYLNSKGYRRKENQFVLLEYTCN